MTIKQANVTINVKDMETAVSFYFFIGLTVKNRWGNYYAQLTAPGITIGLHPTSNHLKEIRNALSVLPVMILKKQIIGEIIDHGDRKKRRRRQFLHYDPDGPLYILSNQMDRIANKFSIDHYSIDQTCSKRIRKICQ